MRYVEIPREGSSRRRGAKCKKTGCTKNTAEQKPFCTDHIDEHPYVRELLKNHELVDVEHEQVRKKGMRAVDLNGHTVSEILRTLKHEGHKSIARLARQMDLDTGLLVVYLRRLKREKCILITRQTKGTDLVCLVPTDD